VCAGLAGGLLLDGRRPGRVGGLVRGAGGGLLSRSEQVERLGLDLLGGLAGVLGGGFVRGGRLGRGVCRGHVRSFQWDEDVERRPGVARAAIAGGTRRLSCFPAGILCRVSPGAYPAAMTAEPSGPPPDFAALDRRLRAVEHRQEHELTHEIAATGEAVRLLHDGLRGVDRAVTRVDQRLDQVAASQQDLARVQAEQAGVLTTIAGRLYNQERVLAGLAGKVDGLEGKVDAQGETLAGHSATLAGHGEMLAGHSATLAGHGEMLAEILRRLPAAGE
jgi:hypothetical protein